MTRVEPQHREALLALGVAGEHVSAAEPAADVAAGATTAAVVSLVAPASRW